MCLEQMIIMIELVEWKLPPNLFFPYFPLCEKMVLPGKQLKYFKATAFLLSQPQA